MPKPGQPPKTKEQRPRVNPDDELLMAKEAAEMLGVHVNFIYSRTRDNAVNRYGKDGVMPHLRIGDSKTIRIWKSELLEWLEKQRYR